MEGVGDPPNTDRSLLLLFLNALTASPLLSPRDPHYMWIYIGEGGAEGASHLMHNSNSYASFLSGPHIGWYTQQDV